MELTPIDWCARAAVALRRAPLAACHLQSPAPPTVEQVCRAVVPGLQVLPDEDFARRLAQAPVDLRGDLLAPLIDLYNRLREAPPTITVDSRLTLEQLERVGFDQAVPGPERLLRAFRFDAGERLREEGA